MSRGKLAILMESGKLYAKATSPAFRQQELYYAAEGLPEQHQKNVDKLREDVAESLKRHGYRFIDVRENAAECADDVQRAMKRELKKKIP